MRGSKQLLSLALAMTLVLAVYVPTHIPHAMAAALEITNEVTCKALPEEVSPEWTDSVCQIDSGTLVVDNILRINSGVTFEITSGSGVQLDAGATLDNDGTITNDGIIEAVGAADIVNAGTINNTGSFTTGPSTMDNPGVINNSGDFIVSADGTLTNTGTISNHATILNSGTIDNDGTFDNFGTIENECDVGVVTGEISGNQPEDDCDSEDPESGSISGFKFEDEDGDGEWDSEGGEGTIAGVTICAFGDGMEEAVCDETDSETGEYLLADLPLGVELEVYEQVPDGYEQTAPQDFEGDDLFAEGGSYFVTLDSEDIEDLNFGNQQAEDIVLYATDAGGGSLYTIYAGTGEAALVGPMGLDSVPSLAADPTTGLMYAGTGGGDALLLAVDPVTGEAFIIGDAGLGFSAIGALTFDSEGILYASVNLAGNGGTGSDHLATIDISTGEAQVIGPYGECEGIVVPTDGDGACEIEGMEGLSFATDGTLYGATNNAELYTIDLDTGAASFVAPIQDGNETEIGIASIQFAPDGTLYAGTARGVGDFGTIDPSDGLFVLISHAFEDFSLGALAFCEQCESPGTGTVSGFKFVDEDGDGEWEEGEEPLSGVTICAYRSSIEDPIACDETGEDGGYEMTLLAGVELVISEDVPEGYEQTAPMDFEEEGLSAEAGSYFLTLDPEETIDNLDFGNRVEENSPPVANAGPDQTVDEGASVELDGSDSSDEETDSVDLEYSWTQVSGTAVELTGHNTASPTFTAPSNVNTVLVFNLTVTDEGGSSDSDTASVTVQGRGDLTIRKVVQGTGDLLAGSAFTITPNPLTSTGPPAGSLVVEDNGDNDSDPADGIIKVEGVRFASYTLVESQVPEGHAKLVSSLSVAVHAGNLAPTVIVQNLDTEQEIEETEVPPPQLDEEQVDDLEDNGAEIDGQPVNSTNLPPAVITPPGQTPQVPKPVIFTNQAPPNTNGSALFTDFNIPTYPAPDPSLAAQTTYSPPAFVVPKDDGSNFVLSPVIEEIFEDMTMLLTPPSNTAVTSASIQSVEIEFGQAGDGIGFSFDLSSDIPEGLPELDDIDEVALFLDVDFVGNVNFSDPTSFASPPEFVILVSRSLDGETLPDGCPDIELYLLNENTNEWEEIDTPDRNPAGDTATECSYIVHTEHFSKFGIGSVKGTISAISTGGGGGGGGSRTAHVDGTFPGQYFVTNPLAKMRVTASTFVAPDGQVDNTFAAGSQVHFANTIRNYQQDSQSYVFIVQVLDSNGVIHSLSFQAGVLARAQEIEVGQSWLADRTGDYQVRMYVWSSFEAPDALSTVTTKMIKVTEIGPSQSA